MKTLIALLMLTSAASAGDTLTAADRAIVPPPISDEAKILALKLGYALNGDSMVRWGSIDLTDPYVAMGPIPRSVPTTTVKPEKRK